MSGDSSLGIGIGLALKSYGRGLTYVKTDRALDLGNLAPFTIPDLSGNANTATLYSGIYVTTNGTTDKAIGANATALGSGNYYLSGKIKPAGTTAKTTMNGSTASNLTGLTAGVWQDFQTATASAITPSSINLGWDGTAFNTTVDNWSDVKLHDASDDSVVAHWKLYDSADASLDGYPALDCVGGYHGAHVGCAGGSGEGVDADVAGISATLDDKMYFDGVDDYVEYSQQNFTSKTINAVFTYDSGADVRVFAIGDNAGGSQLAVTLNSTKNGNSDIVIGFDALGNLGIDDLGLNHGDLIELSVTTNASKSVISGTVNGVAIGATDADNRSGLGSKTVIGTHDGVSTGYYTGIFFSLEIEGDFLVNNTGATDAAWEDQIGSNDGTVNGNPVTVGQKRETILQTAGEDFNKRMWFGGVGSGDYINCGILSGFTSYTEISISLKFAVSDNTSRIISILHSGGDDIRMNITVAGALEISTDDGTPFTLSFGAGFNDGMPHTALLTLNGDGLSATVDGTTLTNGSATFNFGTGNGLCLIGSQSSAFAPPGSNLTRGLIYDVEISNQSGATHSWIGNGNTNAAWVDQIGSNNGTVNGSPSLYHVAESETTAGQDALGNAIVNPRANERVLNLTTGTGYAEVADSASLDLTTEATWEMWGNFYGDKGMGEIFLSRDVSGAVDRCWNIGRGAGIADNRINIGIVNSINNGITSWQSTNLSDKVQQVVFTYSSGTLKIYVDSVEGTLTKYFGATIASTLPNRDYPVLVGAFNAPALSSFVDRQIGDVRIYDRVLTADEILKNYNARKSAYGL